jgi:NitT/TauT family transport system substrate-binding protein
MERGNIKVTYLDLANTRRLTTGPMASKFMVLPAGGQSASDEILYATTDYIAANQDVIQVLLEEILKATRAVNADYHFADRERERLGLLKDLPPKMIEETNPYFEQAVAAGLFPNDGGGESAARADLEFLILAGRLQGKASDMNLADFWDFGPLKKARAAPGPAK